MGNAAETDLGKNLLCGSYNKDRDLESSHTKPTVASA
jgi:hypothetical protein